MGKRPRRSFGDDFKTFFLRGLGILLPSIVTFWILWQAFTFVQGNVAEPINRGVRIVVLWATPKVIPETKLPDWYVVSQQEVDDFRETEAGVKLGAEASDQSLTSEIQRSRLRQFWHRHWYLDGTGLLIAIVVLYLIGALLSGFIGRQVYTRIERLLSSLPGFKQVYPHVKQLVDMVMGEQKMAFSRVVLLEYPRKGIWTVGLVTSSSMRPVAEVAGGPVLSILIPTSPTPFTGFVINVLESDVIELDISIEEALRFLITGGVLVPDQFKMDPAAGVPVVEPMKPAEGQALPESAPNKPGHTNPDTDAGDART